MQRQGSFHQLVFHFVWSTHNRQPLITDKVEQALLPYISRKCVALGCQLHAANGTADHFHLLLELPPTLTITKVVQQLKGGSSHFINTVCKLDETLHWQDGYGVVSLRAAEIPKVVRYIQNQKEHHKMGKLSELLERTE